MLFVFTGCGGGVKETINNYIQEQVDNPKIEKEEPNSEPEPEPEPNTNTKPIAQIADKITRENNVSIDFVGNAFDADNDTLSFIWKEGEEILSYDQNFTKDDFDIGDHNITFTVTDSHGESDNVTMIVTIKNSNDENDTPTALDQSIVTDENRAISFNLNVNDVDGDVLTMQLTKQPTHGKLTGEVPNLTYTPNKNFRGSDEITYSVNDGSLTSNNATIYIKIKKVNHIPTVDAGVDKKIRLGFETWISATANDSDGDIVKYEWKEAGQVISNKQSFRYKPATVGKHTLTLTVTDNDNATVSDSVVIDATNKVPLIIIQIEFNDQQFKSDTATWSKKIFGTSEGELNHYFNEISYGKLQFEKAKESDGVKNDGIITVRLNENHPGFVKDFNKSVKNFPTRIVEAIKLTDSYINYAQYDTDGNNAISLKELQIMFLVAGGESATGVNPGVWARAWSLSEGFNATPPTLDGVRLMDYATHGTYSRFGESHFKHGRDATIGIIAHELGHAALGLADLYDTKSVATSEGIGNFGLMGAGNWGRKNSTEYRGSTPIHMTGWSKIKSNFISPIVINKDTQNQQFRGTSFKDYQLYKILTQRENEYFLVENRSNNGYDRGLFTLEGDSDFTGGLSILHIDDNLEDNNNVYHKMVDIEEANNAVLDTPKDDETHRGHINNLFFSGNSDSFTPTTSPNSNLYDGRDSRINITNISDVGNTMSADIDIK